MPHPLCLRGSNPSDETLDAINGSLLTTAKITTLPSSACAANEASAVNKSAALISRPQKLYSQSQATLDAIACTAVKRRPLIHQIRGPLSVFDLLSPCRAREWRCYPGALLPACTLGPNHNRNPGNNGAINAVEG